VVVAGALAIVLLFVAGSIFALRLDGKAEFTAQAKRVEALRAEAPAVSPSLAADLALRDDLPLDKLRLLATHNSYRRGAHPLGLFFIGLIQPDQPAKLAYAHAPLTQQLDEGLRSFELDLRARENDFVIAHVPLVDTRTWEPAFAPALEEIALWSDRNPRHLPIVLLFELKNDYAFLDPALKPWTAGAFDRLDATIRASLGARLFSPDDLSKTLREGKPATASGKRSWPTIATLRGRILVILHENEEYRAIYETGHPGLSGRAMFDCLPGGAPGAFFAILNEPVKDAAAIKAAVARGTIARTRADADLVLDPALLAAALASGAQIVSTDFPPGHAAPGGYTASLPEGRYFDLLP
jgi:hypothetical protein